MFSWVSRYLERVYGEGLVTEAKNKDIGMMLKLIITEEKQGFGWGKSRPKILGGVLGGGGVGLRISLQKKEGGI